MQMQILKIAVVLLVAGSSDARPQASGRFLKENRKQRCFEGGYNATEMTIFIDGNHRDGQEVAFSSAKLIPHCSAMQLRLMKRSYLIANPLM